MEGLNFTRIDKTVQGLNSNSSLSNFIVCCSFTFTLVIVMIVRTFGNRHISRGHKDRVSEKLAGPEHLSGPKCWDPTGIIGNELFFHPLSKTLSIGLSWGERYGDMFKFIGLGQTWVVLNSGPTVQSLCGSSDLGHLIKPKLLFDLMKPYISNGLFVSTGETWQHDRKILLKSQSYSSLKSYMPMLDKHCKLFVSGLEKMFEDGKPHEINDLINSSFIKVICEMITGFDRDQSHEYIRYHHNFQIWKETMAYRILHPWLGFTPIWRLHPGSRKNETAVQEMNEFARRRIREHKEKRAQLELLKTTSTSPFRCVLEDLIDEGMEEAQIISEINAMVFGGHDTGASTIHFLCLCMALNPEIQNECQKEVDDLFEDHLNFMNGTLTYNAISGKLKLVERCILETMRLFPSAFIFIRKLHSPLRINYNDQTILLPTGTNAVVSPYLLHRKAEYFPEPGKYDPNRFLPEECRNRHSHAFVPFSAGPRNCLGMKFAMIEMKTIAAYILRHFFITTTDRIEDVTLLPFITTTPSKDFTFQFSKRNVLNATG